MASNKTRIRPRVGDIVEIDTPQGFAYALFTHMHDEPPVYGELLRVWTRLHANRPESFDDLLKENEQFSVFCPLAASLKEGLCRIVQNNEVPEKLKLFPLFKSGNFDRKSRQITNWWIWDGRKSTNIGDLPKEYSDLPYRCILTIPAITHCLSTGITPLMYMSGKRDISSK